MDFPSFSSHTSGGPSGVQPTNQTGHSTMGMQTNNNNIGPPGTRPLQSTGTSESGFPAGEGILMALAFQTKSLQEQVQILAWGQFHRAAKQRILLSNVKQTTSQNAYVLYDTLAGNQRNPLRKFCLLSSCMKLAPDQLNYIQSHHLIIFMRRQLI